LVTVKDRRMMERGDGEMEKWAIGSAASSLLALLLIPSLVFAFCFEEAGKEYGVPPRLLEVLAGTESAMNPRALNLNTNGSYDIGLMQVNSYWVQVMGLDKDKLAGDPCYNVMTGARILKQCMDRYGYNWEAVGCYNATSLQKKITYSWRVFHALSATRKQPEVQVEPRPSSSSSLVFEMRDIPEERAGKQ
jgi:soluble lytic murein transglycosylase-like protein